jgi:hypothetical protein
MLDLFHTVYRSAAGDDDARPDESPPLRCRIRGRVVSEGWIRAVVMLELDRSGKAAVIGEVKPWLAHRSLHFYTR